MWCHRIGYDRVAKVRWLFCNTIGTCATPGVARDDARWRAARQRGVGWYGGGCAARLRPCMRGDTGRGVVHAWCLHGRLACTVASAVSECRNVQVSSCMREARKNVWKRIDLVFSSRASGLGRGDKKVKQKEGCERAGHLGAGRLRVWALSPVSYLTAPPAHPIEPGARIGRCRSAQHSGVVVKTASKANDLAWSVRNPWR